jgi:hypothetical protein
MTRAEHLGVSGLSAADVAVLLDGAVAEESHTINRPQHVVPSREPCPSFRIDCLGRDQIFHKKKLA